MAIRIKEINGKNYVYFIHYPEGKKVDVYCGVESKPESQRKALVLEMDETKRQIAALNEKLIELTTKYEGVKRDGMTRTPPPDKTSKAKQHRLKKFIGHIIHGDCLDVMREMPDETIKIIVTSPPYNIKNSVGNGLKNGSGGKPATPSKPTINLG